MALEFNFDGREFALLANWSPVAPERLIAAIRTDLETVAAQVAELAATAAPDAPGAVTPAWMSATIGSVALLGPRAPSRDELPDDTEVSFVAMAAVDGEQGIVASPEGRRAGEVRRGHVSFREGDVLFAKISPSMENGKVAVASNLLAGCGFGSTEFFVLRPVSGVLPAFLHCFLRRPALRATAAERMTGKAGQQRVPAAYLRSIPMPLTATGEQERIVGHLSDLEDRHTKNLQMLKAASERTAEARRSANWLACVGRLDAGGTPADSRRHDDVLTEVCRARSQGPRRGRSHPRFLAPRPSNIWSPESLPALPKGWEWTSVGFAASRMQYGTSARSSADENTGVPNVGMQNIQNGQLDVSSLRHVALDEDTLSKFLLNDGDVLFNRTNSPELVGKAAVFNASMRAVFASYLIRITVDDRVADPRFVTSWINSSWGRAWAAAVKRDAVSQSNINMSVLAAMPLPWAPVERQRALCDRLAELRADTDELDRRAEDLRRAGEVIRWEIVDSAFAGTLQVPGAPVHGPAPATLPAAASSERASQPVSPPRRVQSQQSADISPAPLAAAVARFGDRAFSFDELVASAGLEYEALVVSLYAALGAESPILHQRFDSDSKRMAFRRGPA